MNEGIEVFSRGIKKSEGGLKNSWVFYATRLVRYGIIKIKVDKFKAIWIAAYGRNTGSWDASPETSLSYKMQQFTDQGTVPGYSGNVDLNMVNNQSNYNELFKNQK
ncbi:hypothetical protein LLT6_05515, partial [Lactococcus cremoris subsp. cremoris TIFN6]